MMLKGLELLRVTALVVEVHRAYATYFPEGNIIYSFYPSSRYSSPD
jgi:hypothetical protein